MKPVDEITWIAERAVERMEAHDWRRIGAYVAAAIENRRAHANDPR
jgi:hypothetical protein